MDHLDDNHAPDRPKQSRERHATTKWQSAIENFSPMWFSICISSGGLALVLTAPFPYPARWLAVCGDVLFAADLALFVLFLAATAARWLAFPRAALRRLASDQQELSAYAIAPIALLVLSALVARRVSTAGWGGGGSGHAFALVAYVMWWAGAALMLAYCATVIGVLAYSRRRVGRVMLPALFMPIVGVATAAVEAGSISQSAYGMSARLAVPMLVVGWFLVGLAMWMALMLYTIFLHRLMTRGWPEKPGVPALAILVGPSGQVASAFQQLGQEAGKNGRFAEYARGTFFTQQTGDVFEGASIMLSMLFMGLSFMWFMVAMYAIVDMGFVKGRPKYTLTWWAMVFPITTLDTALLQLAKAMDSPAFRVLATALFVFLMIAYLTNLAFTVWSVFKGNLLFPASQDKDERARAEEEQNDSDRSDETFV